MLQGEQTRLRGLAMSDVDNCLAWLNDPEVTRFVTMRPPVSRPQEEAWFARTLSGQDSGNIVFAMETLDGEYLGNIGLHGIDYVSGVAEIGIVIGNKKYWGKGCGPDAMRVLIRYAFQQLRMRKVILRVFGTNIRAQKAYHKIGFAEVGRLKEHVLKDGMFEDEIFMELFPDQLK